MKRLELSEFLPYRLSILSNLVSSAIASEYAAQFNLSISGWRIMASVALTPDISAVKICEVTQMDKVAVSRAVNSLLNQGYIERRACDDDRRQSIIRLSPLGNEIYEKIVPIAVKHESNLLEGLSLEKRNLLNELLNDLTASARRIHS